MGLRDALKSVRDRAARVAQAVLLPAGLFLAYFVGVGLTRLLARLLRPDLLGPRRKEDAGLWRDAEGYGEDDARGQS